VKPGIVVYLIDINRRFYQNFAVSFSATRRRLQPGVMHILNSLPECGLLDIGCGNGELAVVLGRRGWRGNYLGLDFSDGLLAEAEAGLARLSERPLEASFAPFDLSNPGGLPNLAAPIQPIHTVTAFAVLHHLPSRELRLALLGQIRKTMEASGDPAPVFIHSEWQFLNSPRLAARCIPWEKAGINAADVEPGDYLLDWRRGGEGLRYVHAFNEAELDELAESSGFHIRETFYSDGDNGRLGLYQVWELPGHIPQ
jgi:SAM-dependent methyltransferase